VAILSSHDLFEFFG
jgi:hypothetical protein